MDKKSILKISGHKDLKSFYLEYPTEEVFMKAHGKQFKKALLGERLKKAQTGDTVYDEWKATQEISNPVGSGTNGFMNQLNKLGGISGIANTAGKVVGGFQQLADEKKKKLQAYQMRDLSKLQLQASRTREELPERDYVRPEDMIIQPNQLSNPYGEGTNVLGRNGLTLYRGGEIANTYAPGTLYDNLGYEPLNESNKKSYYYGGELPKAQNGFNEFMVKQGGGEALGNIVNAGFDNAGSSLGNAAADVFGMIPGVGKLAGSIAKPVFSAIGGLLDRNPQKIKKAQKATQRNIGQMAFNDNIQGVQSQYGSYMEDGGNLTNPQLITKFGEHTMRELLAPDPTMDTLRTGGHLRQNVMDGDLQMYKGGAESISYNPFLPEGGETVEFRGPSHEEGGMNVAYGRNPVEVEGGEPAVKLQNGGGQSDLVVFGNLNIPKGILNDPKAKGKFKSYIKDIAKQETHKNKIADKSIEALNNLDVNTSFDKLSLASYRANLMGAKSSLKELAEKKEDAAALQQAINDTSEELGVEADSLSKGKIKKAAGGITLDSYFKNRNINLPSPGDLSTLPTPEIESIRGKMENIPEERQREKFPWMDVINSALPYFRPTDAEPLDANQLLGEMYALSNNQLEPVQAQTYQPQLRTPYDIVLPRNEMVAQSRAIQRSPALRGNPAAQTIAAAQAYDALSKISGEEFRANQALKEQVYSGNQATLNDAQASNLILRDKQYTRQSEAKSNTKAVAQNALASIAAKYQQNKLDNRTLQTYENLYNYRYDNRERAINWNGLAQFSPYGSGAIGENAPLAPGRQNTFVMDERGNLMRQDVISKSKGKSSGDHGKNGAIVRALKNL